MSLDMGFLKFNYSPIVEKNELYFSLVNFITTIFIHFFIIKISKICMNEKKFNS